MPAQLEEFKRRVKNSRGFSALSYAAICTSLALSPILCQAQTSTSSQKSAWLDPASTLEVRGKSNIDAFICKLKRKNAPDTLFITLERDGKELHFIDATWKFPVDCFDCGNRIMTRDFQSTLHGDKYPNLILRLKSITLPSENGEPSNGVATMEIEIAGQKSIRRMPLNRVNSSSGHLMLAGDQKLKMSWFGIAPPRLLMGLVTISDDITIRFYFLVKMK